MKWMKRNKKNIFFIILVILSIWLTAVQINRALQAREVFTSESVRLTEGTMKAEAIKAALEKEKEINTLSVLKVTAWSTLNNKIIENAYLNRKERVTAIVVSGDMLSTIPMNLRYGNYVYKEDKKGCVIDGNTAYSLFGTENAVENLISYNKKQYCIRGIVESEIPAFLYQGMDRVTEYTNLELSFSEMGNGEELANQFMKIYGLSNDYVMIDGYFFGKIIYSVLMLPLWLLLFYFIIDAGFVLVKKRSVYAVVMILIMVCGGFFLYKILGNPFYLPEKLIPTMWSDFSFWKEQWKEVKNQIMQIRYLNPNLKDVFLLERLSKLFYNFSSMIVLYVASISFWKKRFGYT